MERERFEFVARDLQKQDFKNFVEFVENLLNLLKLVENLLKFVEIC